MPWKGAKCPLFHAPCRTDAGTTLDASATHQGQWSRSSPSKVWSWAKATPQTKTLEERKDSLGFCLLSKCSTKNLSWDAQEGLYFPGYAPPVHTRARFLHWPLIPQVYESSPELPKRKPQVFKFPGVLKQRRGDYEVAYSVTGRSELF